MKIEAKSRLTAYLFPYPVVNKAQATYHFRYHLELKRPGGDWWEVKCGANYLDGKFEITCKSYLAKFPGSELRIIDNK